MKLLFDENLSRRLVKDLADLYPGSEQVVRLGLERSDDGAIWALAKPKGYTIVTQGLRLRGTKHFGRRTAKGHLDSDWQQPDFR